MCIRDRALVKHHARIRVADSGQTVCYYKYSAPLHEVIHTLLDKRLCAGIDLSLIHISVS